MNPYFQNLCKIEFVLTYACTGACKHCSQGEHPKSGSHPDPETRAEVVKILATRYPLETVLVFGGEPLLYPNETAQIIAVARDAQIPHRQIITNGFFTSDEHKMRRTAKSLAESGVNDLLLSADAFHQETIPLETVHRFARLAKEAGIPVRIQPAWLKSAEDQNPYNEKTRAILQVFRKDGFEVGDGNIVFPEGNAKRYLAEYFTNSIPENPYVENPRDLHTLSIAPDGSVLQGNLHEKSILELMDTYKP